jgi:hypothetical protein
MADETTKRITKDAFGSARPEIAWPIAWASFLRSLQTNTSMILSFGLVHSTIKVIEEHRLRHNRPFTHAQQFEDAVLFAGEMPPLVINRHYALTEVYHYLARLDPPCVGFLVRSLRAARLSITVLPAMVLSQWAQFHCGLHLAAICASDIPPIQSVLVSTDSSALAA